MGLSTAAVFALLFAVSAGAVIQLLTAQEEYSLFLSYEEGKAFDRASREIRSGIEITGVAYSAGGLVITVNNTGNVALDPEHVYLVVNDTWLPEGRYSVNLLQPPSKGYWEPTEAVEITYTTTPGDWTVKVVVETGIEDRYEFAA